MNPCTCPCHLPGHSVAASGDEPHRCCEENRELGRRRDDPGLEPAAAPPPRAGGAVAPLAVDLSRRKAPALYRERVDKIRRGKA